MQKRMSMFICCVQREVLLDNRAEREREKPWPLHLAKVTS